MADAIFPKQYFRTGKAIAKVRRSESGTAPQNSCNSISTANCSIQFIFTTNMENRSATNGGWTFGEWGFGFRKNGTGGRREFGSGRGGAGSVLQSFDVLGRSRSRAASGGETQF